MKKVTSTTLLIVFLALFLSGFLTSLSGKLAGYNCCDIYTGPCQCMNGCLHGCDCTVPCMNSGLCEGPAGSVCCFCFTG